MKIGILTIHYGVNYGSALQAYALSNFLRKNGFNVEVINYIPERYRISPYFPKAKKNWLTNSLFILARFPMIFLRRKVFSDFLKKNVPMSKLYKNIKELYKDNLKYDIYVTGSDQVWNKEYNGKTQDIYYLKFVPENSIKIACSASFGVSRITKKEELLEIYEALKDFKAISVREDSGLKILQKAGIRGAVQVLDPTFLFDKDSWVKHFDLNPLITEPYILVYALDNEEKRLIEFASKIAKLKGYKIALISLDNRRRNKKKVNYSFYNKSPEYFINLFSNADYVVTNSFHGVAFSINFRKQFIALSRKLYNSRLESILNLFDLSSRLTKRENDLDLNIALKEIDYNEIYLRIEEQRRKLEKFLLENIGL